MYIMEYYIFYKITLNIYNGILISKKERMEFDIDYNIDEP